MQKVELRYNVVITDMYEGKTTHTLSVPNDGGTAGVENVTFNEAIEYANDWKHCSNIEDGAFIITIIPIM